MLPLERQWVKRLFSLYKAYCRLGGSGLKNCWTFVRSVLSCFHRDRTDYYTQYYGRPPWLSHSSWAVGVEDKDCLVMLPLMRKWVQITHFLSSFDSLTDFRLAITHCRIRWHLTVTWRCVLNWGWVGGWGAIQQWSYPATTLALVFISGFCWLLFLF